MRAGSRWKLIGAVTGALALGVAGLAWATTTGEVHYKPPLLQIVDHQLHGTQEDVEVVRSGSEFVITNPSSGLILSSDSDPGCTGSFAEYHCPRAGVEVLRIKTNDLDDRAQVDLKASAGKVKQFLLLGDGEDQGIGKTGKQKIVGGEGNDTLKGGAGPDILIGGPGDDTCKGGPGKDVIKSC